MKRLRRTESPLLPGFVLHHGDCLEVMRGMDVDSVDAIVTDPPYGISFMGRKWDYDVPTVEIWRAARRVLKPGGYLLSFAGTRTQHRMCVNIEDAGFEIRDIIAWLYGTGFPKSYDISKAIDKAAGVERRVIGTKVGMQGYSLTDGKGGLYGKGICGNGTGLGECTITAPTSDGAKKWAGWGTALKPAMELITMARKPFSEKTIAANVLKHGTGGLNVDGCRVGTEVVRTYGRSDKRHEKSQSLGGGWSGIIEKSERQGRWPANLIHDGSDEGVKLFPETGAGKSAARFFYCAKASKHDRDEGLDRFEEKQAVGGGGGVEDYLKDINSASGKFGSEKALARNPHPTVKPMKLMCYLCRLVAQPRGIVLDPFMGSGSTGKACAREGFRFIGIELDKLYVDISRSRIQYVITEVEENQE